MPTLTGRADGPRQILGRDPAALLALVQAALTLALSFEIGRAHV